MDKPNDSESIAPAEKKPRRRLWLAAVGVLIVLYAIPAALTSSPKACASCHSMKPYFESWQVSSHRAAAPSCLYCHAKPGLLNAVAYRFTFYREIAAHVTGQKLMPIGTVAASTQSCQRSRCHSMNRETSNSGDLRINHRLHIEQAGIPCTKCHPGAVHKDVEGRALLPPMSICEECHAERMDDCEYCHVGRPPASSGAHPSAVETSEAVGSE